MYYLIKKNQKKLMAIFAVLLMISFVATIGVGRYGGGGSRSDAVVGHMGKTAVNQSDFREAESEWNWARRTPAEDPVRGPIPVALDALLYSMVPRPPDPRAGRDEYFQWLMHYAMPGRGDSRESRYQRAELAASRALQAIQQHPELLYLLSEEAVQDGVQIDPNGDEVNSYLVNVLHMDPADVKADSLARGAVRRLMLIAQQFQRLGEAVTVSRPAWQHDAAEQQSVRLNLIDFRAGDFERSVPAPTTQRAQEQFERFKDVAPGTSAGAGNPLGFGYRIPARVKLQYLTIPHAQVLDAVIHHVHPAATADLGGTSGGDAAYDWDVQAALYYDQHKDEFQNDNKPSNKPESRPATQASTKPAVPLGPVIPFKPFAEVKQQIIDKLTAPEVEKLSKQIADEITARLSSDFDTIRQADPSVVVPSTTQPTTRPAADVASAEPATRPARDLMMLAHLEQIRSEIQQKHQVAVELHDIVSDWQTRTELAKLPGIGSATALDGAPFAEFATTFAHPGMTFSAPALSVWQPSAPLTDAGQNVYLFRLTAAEPPHAPPDLAAVAQQVEHDWSLGKAYEQAMDAAQKALTSAKTSGLPQAARTAGQPVVFTPLFSPQQAQDVPGYTDLPPDAARDLLAAATDLIAQATPADKRPDALVALPGAQRVIVMELAGVQLPDAEWLAQLRITSDEQLTELQRLAGDWFNYDQVVARTSYKAEEKS